jgi:hypothetical protein
MKLPEYRQTFYDLSGKVSELTRQLAFAGIAIVWIFKKDAAADKLTIPGALMLPLLLLVLSLASDILQYFAGTAIWWLFYRLMEMRGFTDEEELGKHSPWLEAPIWLFFLLKFFLLIVAYFFIGRYLAVNLAAR